MQRSRKQTIGRLLTAMTITRVFLLLLFLLFGVLIPPLAAADTAEAPLTRFYTSETLAMGSTQGALSSGYQALFANPAGIARENSVDLLTVAMGPRVNLDPYITPFLEDQLISGYQSTEYYVCESILENGDLRNSIGGIYGISGGASFYGFGIGWNYTVEPLFTQQREDDPVMLSYLATAAVGGGFSYGFNAGGGTLYVGADVKQVVQTTAETQFASEELASYLHDENGVLSSLPAFTGNGYALGAGAIYETGPLLLSLQVKNIGGTRLGRHSLTLEEALEVNRNLLNLELREGSFGFGHFIPLGTGSGSASIPDTIIPMSVILGAGVDISLGNVLRVQAAGDYEYIFYRDEANRLTDTFWKNVHIGGEVGLFDTVRLRGGINQGYLTGGFGVTVVKVFNLLDVELNGSYYALELGSYAGHRQSEGLLFDVTVSLRPDFSDWFEDAEGDRGPGLLAGVGAWLKEHASSSSSGTSVRPGSGTSVRDIGSTSGSRTNSGGSTTYSSNSSSGSGSSDSDFRGNIFTAVRNVPVTSGSYRTMLQTFEIGQDRLLNQCGGSLRINGGAGSGSFITGYLQRSYNSTYSYIMYIDENNNQRLDDHELYAEAVNRWRGEPHVNLLFVEWEQLNGASSSGSSRSGLMEEFLVGDRGPAGGWIFYDDEADGRDDIPGYRYLEAAPAGWYMMGTPDPSFQWGARSFAVDHLSSRVGSGEKNTIEIVNKAQAIGLKEYAAGYCTDLTIKNRGESFADWFLPSQEELDLLFQNLFLEGKAGMSSDQYWSSSDDHEDDAWFQDFSDSKQYNTYAKDRLLRVRPVRAF
jgi:hypothetical protein